MARVEVQSPYDGSEVASFDVIGSNDVETALRVADDLSRGDLGKQLPLSRRIEICEKAADLLEGRLEEFAMAACREGGKPLTDSRVEAKRALTGIRESARAMQRLVGREIPMGIDERSADRHAFTIREPIGTVVSVSAFNHPLNLIVHQVMPALAAGCPVIVKPASDTPHSCHKLCELLYEAGLPEQWCQMLSIDNDAASRLVTDSRVRFFSFIGSARVGWTLRSKLAPGTRCALEHGGVAPVIVEQDADVDEAIPLLKKGGFYHAGQVCVSVQRVFVHEAIFDDFADKLVGAVEGLNTGDPTSDRTDVGPLIRPGEVDRVESWVQEAAADGAVVRCGGERMSDRFFAPTVLTEPKPDAKVSTQEVFGPVVCLYKYRDVDDAITQANALPFSFQAAVFTQQFDRAFDIARKLKAAACMINDHTAFRVDWMPFAGQRESGLGVGGIESTLEEVTQEKLIVMKSTAFRR